LILKKNFFRQDHSEGPKDSFGESLLDRIYKISILFNPPIFIVLKVFFSFFFLKLKNPVYPVPTGSLWDYPVKF
jgi:hypothetical protein